MGGGTLNREREEFTIDIGVKYAGKSDFHIDYTVVENEIAANLPLSPYLNYESAVKVNPNPGSRVLAYIHEPYFNRTLEHYSSHRNTPYKMQKADYPAVVLDENAAYIAHAVDKQYFENGSKVHRDLFRNVLDLVHQNPMIKVNLPSSGRVNLLHQPESNRYVVHLLYAVPIQRGIAQVIEDMVPLYDITVKIKLPEKVSRVYTIPDNEELRITKKDGYLEVVIPKLLCHQAVVYEYNN